MIRFVFGTSLAALALLVLTPAAPAEDTKAVDRAVERGVAYLRATQRKDGRWPLPAIGATALAGLTLLECGIPADDPGIQKAARAVREEASGVLVTYSLSLCILFLERLGDKSDEPLIQAMGVRLLAGQNSDGGWTYYCPSVSDAEQRRLKQLFKQRTALVAREKAGPGGRPAVADPGPEILGMLASIAGRQVSAPDDNSNTQFAILGLWVARRHGIPIEVAMARVQARFRGTQNSNAGWGYSAHYGGDLATSTYTMTCAGLLGLACAYGSTAEAAPADGKSRPPLDPASERGIRRALQALGMIVGRPVPSVGPSHSPVGGYAKAAGADARGRVTREYAFYFLWSLERVAVAYGLKTIGQKDWYAWGVRALLRTQHGDGSWRGACALGGADTCFALLFLRRVNLAPDLTAQLKGVVKDPEAIMLRAGFGGEQAADNRPAEQPERGYGEQQTPTPAPAAPATPAAPKRAEPAAPVARPAAPAPADEDASRLVRQLVGAPVAVQKTLLVRFRDAKGPAYTAALAQAIPKLGSELQRQARDALAERLTRMTSATLGDKLGDDAAEVRRAAAAACRLKQDKQHLVRLMELLEDREPPVARAAHTALRSLTGQDFGPKEGSSEERARAAAAWKAWWQRQRSP
jgi:hypothetical protein